MNRPYPWDYLAKENAMKGKVVLLCTIVLLAALVVVGVAYACVPQEPVCPAGQITVTPAAWVEGTETCPTMEFSASHQRGHPWHDTETFGPITVQYGLRSQDPNHCHRPNGQDLGVPSWAMHDYNDDLPEHLDKIVTLGYWIDPVCRAPILGCMDPLALNYNAAAEVDDGSCQFPYQVCSMTGDWVFADATAWALESEGGTLEVRTVCYNEYDAQDGTTVCNRYCEAEHRPYVPEPIPGCMNPDAINYDPGATQDDGSCEYPPEVVPGCTDPNALNYNEEATVDNGSCEYPPPPPVPGCTDVNATNYDPNATQDDGSCQYPPPPEVCQYNPELTADDPECQAPPPEVCQYNTQIPADDPACQPPQEYHPPEEPATGPEGALPIAEGIAFLAFAGLGAFGIRRMNKK